MASEQDLEYLPKKLKSASSEQTVPPHSVNKEFYVAPPEKAFERFELYKPLDRKQMLKDRMKENPIVPIGLLLIFGSIVKGVRHTLRGQDNQAQRMMYLRIGAQACTILALICGMKYQEWKAYQNERNSDPLNK